MLYINNINVDIRILGKIIIINNNNNNKPSGLWKGSFIRVNFLGRWQTDCSEQK